MKTYTYNKTEIRIAENGKFYICPKGADIDIFPSERANFEIKLFGERQLNLSDDDFVFTGCKETKSGVVLSYTNKREGLEVTVCLDASEGVITQTNTVKNIGDEIVKLTSFSSAYIEGIASGEGKPWYDRDVCIHICYNKWQSEGQWESFSPRQLGLQPATSHNWERESYKINSVGSWSTGIYYPLVIVEDKEADAVWFFETEGAHNWFIKIASYGGYNEPNLSLEASSCDETNGGWYYDLKPGEEYSTERVMMGAVDGGFEEAAECLFIFVLQVEVVAPVVVVEEFVGVVHVWHQLFCFLPPLVAFFKVVHTLVCGADALIYNNVGFGFHVGRIGQFQCFHIGDGALVGLSVLAVAVGEVSECQHPTVNANAGPFNGFHRLQVVFYGRIHLCRHGCEVSPPSHQPFSLQQLPGLACV